MRLPDGKRGMTTGWGDGWDPNGAICSHNHPPCEFDDLGIDSTPCTCGLYEGEYSEYCPECQSEVRDHLDLVSRAG
jgi:hypothetical protein